MRLTQNLLLVAFVLSVIYTDWRWQRIFNAITYPAMLAGLALGALEGIPGELFRGGLLDHLAGLGLGFAVSYPFYAAGGLKAGDAKLLMAVGALRGSAFLLYAAFYGALIGGLIAIGFIAFRRLSRPAPGEAPTTIGRLMRMWIPYGVALGLGALVALALEARVDVG
ncbi:MAG: A24 family peptidase [Candidatus Limnocylindria bacterium]